MEDKKLHIIQNVGTMYQKFGIKGVTMDDVAAEFGISKKTLYQYFSGKKDLVSHVVDYIIETSEIDFNTVENGNAIDNMFAIRNQLAKIVKVCNTNFEDDLKRSFPYLFKKINDTKRQRIFENAISNLKQGMAQGMYRDDLDLEFIARLLVGRVLYALNPDFGCFEAYEINSLSFFEGVMDYHMNAICTEKGLKYYKKQFNPVYASELREEH